MTAETWVSISLAVIAFAALFFTGRSAKAAKDQTAIQRQLREDAAQPYVWADLRPDEPQAGLLLFIVGNSGPTVATNVRIRFDLPPTDQHQNHEAGGVFDRLAIQGISSLPPGRTMAWSLGSVQAALSPTVGSGSRHAVTITCDGPFGSLPALSYFIDLEDLRYTRAVGSGSMRHIADSINALAKALKPK
jgi:hypothetical protein